MPIIDDVMLYRMDRKFDLPSTGGPHEKFTARRLGVMTCRESCEFIRSRISADGGVIPTKKELKRHIRSEIVTQYGVIMYLIWAMRIWSWIEFIWSEFDNELALLRAAKR